MIEEKVKAIKGKTYAGSSLRNGKLYHDLPFKGMEGFSAHRGRTRARIEQIASLVDVYDKSIVDIGCSVGGISLGMVEKGAEFVNGIDYDIDSLNVAREASRALGFNGNTSFLADNINIENIKFIEDIDIVIWLSQWMWFVKQHGLETGKQALFEISRNNKMLVFESAADDAMAAIKGATQGTIKEWLYENTCYDVIEEHDSVGGWHDRKLFVCKNPVILIKDKWVASNSIIERISAKEIKKTFKPKSLWMVDREVKALERLEKYNHFPTIIDKGDNYITMQFVGRQNMLKKEMIPQVDEIIDALKKEKIKHRDIREENLLVLNGVLYLIDFGFCIFDDEEKIPDIETSKRFDLANDMDEKNMVKFLLNH